MKSVGSLKIRHSNIIDVIFQIELRSYKLKKYLVILMAFKLMVFVSASYADGPGWTVSSEVIKIIVVQSGGVNIRLSPELSGCTSQSGYGSAYASIYPDHLGLNAMHANLLAAYMSGKKVTLYLSDSTCKVGEMVIGGTHNGSPNS